MSTYILIHMQVQAHRYILFHANKLKIDKLLFAFFLFFYCSFLQPIPGFQLMHTNMEQ